MIMQFPASQVKHYFTELTKNSSVTFYFDYFREVPLRFTMAGLRYPYTMGAMIMQFPAKYMIQKNWVFKSYLIGLVPTGLLYLKITNSFPDEVPTGLLYLKITNSFP